MLVEKLIIISGVLGASLGIATYSTLLERKLAAWLQDRIGPNRAGPGGMFQPLADGLKLIFKEEFIPAHANKFLFVLGPSLAMLLACMGGAVIPWGNTLEIGGSIIPLQITNIDIGVLYMFGVVSLGAYGIMIGGWSSNNKYSLMGAIRAASQIISYELAMGLSMIAVVMVSGSLSLNDIVAHQHNGHWNVFIMPHVFLIFLVCAFAETNRAPFDLPECETELIGGYHTEYGSMKLGFFLFAEYVNMFISSAFMSTLFFGGYDIPFIDHFGLSHNLVTILGTVFLFAKIGSFIFFFMWVRWTLPRFRYDQLMNLGWKILIPIALVNLIITAVVGLILK
ncbi:MAG: NADH-quinone oxidoreductase subunit NuoH [Bacteroidota bacterium]|jgi:NADH-quinone oxidoreductase subunit H